jgi:hypothetical protein
MTWEHHNDRPEGKAFTGAIFVIIGGLLLFANLNFVNIRPIVEQWWPLLLMVIGLKQLLFWKGPSAWAGGAMWIGIGALFLSRTLGYLQFAISSVIWPLVLIWVGVMIVFGCSGKGRRSSAQSKSEVL